MAIKEAEEVQEFRYHHIISQIMPEVDASNDKAMDKDNSNVEIDEDGDEGIVQVQDDDTYDYVRDQETVGTKILIPNKPPVSIPSPPHVLHRLRYVIFKYIWSKDTWR